MLTALLHSVQNSLARSSRFSSLAVGAVVAAACLLLSATAAANVPDTVVYNGSLSAQGSPVDEVVKATFKLYKNENGGSSIWEESYPTVKVENGHFTVRLGQKNSLSNALTQSTDSGYWIEITINGETLSPRTPLGAVPFAMRAGSCDSCSGSGNGNGNGNGNGGNGDLASRVEKLERQVQMLKQKTAKMKVASKKEPSFDSNGVGQGVDENGSNVREVYYSGVNVHVRNGTGDTSDTNGRGNLVVGYNDTSVPTHDTDERKGSHNVVVGDQHSYTADAYGGLIAGFNNEIAAHYASVSGGEDNTASGRSASVSGGAYNTASERSASVSGGDDNTASGEQASVSGGKGNEASGTRASVSGGWSNVASGTRASVSGGWDNVASGQYASVCGGKGNSASAAKATVSGGVDNIANAEASTVSGGGGVRTSNTRSHKP